MLKKLPCKLAPVLISRFEASHQRLEEVHTHLTLTVYSQLLPGDVSGHIHVGGDVESLLDGFGQQVIQAVAHLGVALSPDVVMMMDAYAVVSQAHQSVGKQVGHLVGGIIGREAEVYAIESAGLAWFAFKLKRSSLGLQPSVLSCRSMLQMELREVECAPGKDVLVIGETHPLGTFLHNGLLIYVLQPNSPLGMDDKAEGDLFALGKRAGMLIISQTQTPGIAPPAQVLFQIMDGSGEMEVQLSS